MRSSVADALEIDVQDLLAEVVPLQLHDLGLLEALRRS